MGLSCLNSTDISRVTVLLKNRGNVMTKKEFKITTNNLFEKHGFKTEGKFILS